MSYQTKHSFGTLTRGDILGAITKRERLFLLVAAVNFIVFVVAIYALGGDALNGFTRDGRYYLSLKGTSTEVSRGVYLYSMAHGIGMFVMNALAVVIGFNARRRAREAIR